MRNGTAKKTAVGGVLAALAIVIMCLGGLIPLFTFVCVVLCLLIGMIVFRICGTRFAVAWYIVVCILGLLLGPDKEAAALFTVLGYYPVIKEKLDKKKLKILWKLVFFNFMIFLLYGLMIFVLGVTQITAEYAQMSRILLAVMVLCGNLTFFLTDCIMGRMERIFKKR